MEPSQSAGSAERPRASSVRGGAWQNDWPGRWVWSAWWPGAGCISRDRPALARAGALRRSPGLRFEPTGQCSAGRRTGPEPVGRRADRRVAALAGRGSSPAARGPAHPQDPVSRLRCCRAPTTSSSIAGWVTSRAPRCRERMATPRSPGTATGSSAVSRTSRRAMPSRSTRFAEERRTASRRMWVVDPEDVWVLERHARSLDHSGHLLSVLLHRLGAPPVHRACRLGGRC